MNTTKYQTRDPKDLKKFHPALRGIPPLAEDSEEFLALASGLKHAGFIRPILVCVIDHEEHVIDDHSRSLLRAAKRWQMTEVPVQVCNSEDAPMLALHSMAHFRHLSKSAIAYLAVPLIQPALDAVRLKKLQNLRKNPENADSALSALSEAQTVEELAEELGISRRILFLAQEVRKAFENKKTYTFNVFGGAKDGENPTMTLKEWFEPKLLQAFVGGEHEQHRPMGLGGIKAGITAVIEGDPNKFNPKKPQQMDFFTEMFTRDAQKFIKLPEAKRQAAIQAVEQIATELPADDCEQLAATYKQMAKIYADAAKVRPARDN